MGDQFVLCDSEVVVEKVKELLLHEVDLGEGEVSAVFLPVHVFGRRVVEIFGGANEDGEEDSVTGASHAWDVSWDRDWYVYAKPRFTHQSRQ